MAERVLWHSHNVENTLLEMGLDSVGLLEAARYAEREKSFCTLNDPIGFEYYLVYAKTARALREKYCPSGWIKDDTYNQAAIRNLNTRIRVVPCNFDKYAGNRLVTPKNKSPKGEVSRKKSVCNKTAWLPGIPDISPELNDGYQNWFLGLHIDEEGLKGAELSLPVAFDGNYFTSFATRIILFSSELEGEKIRKTPSSEDDAVPVIDIAIKRK